MDALIGYSIPIQGLKIGIHQFDYRFGGEFFSHFEGSPIENADISVHLELDKRSDMLILDFDIKGFVETECDRCTATIQLPIEDQKQLVVKYGEAEDDDDEVVFIHREASDFKVAPYLYEFSVLATPFIHKYECENEPNPPCNREILARLEGNSDEDKPSPIWDSLKDFNKN